MHSTFIQLLPTTLTMSLLSNKYVCITGASRGIGRATALECAKHNASGLILHYYGDEETTKEASQLKNEIETLYQGCKVVIVAGDIAQQETSLNVSLDFNKRFRSY